MSGALILETPVTTLTVSLPYFNQKRIPKPNIDCSSSQMELLSYGTNPCRKRSGRTLNNPPILPLAHMELGLGTADQHHDRGLEALCDAGEELLELGLSSRALKTGRLWEIRGSLDT